MIVDKTAHIHMYDGILPYFKEAVDFALSLKEEPVGRYDCTSLPEGAVYAMVQEGSTMPPEDGQVEAHRRYIDVQILLEGGETVYYGDIAEMRERIPYDSEKDIVFYEAAGQPARVYPGMFYLVFPHDGHMPCRYLDQPDSFRKIVLKIRL